MNQPDDRLGMAATFLLFLAALVFLLVQAERRDAIDWQDAQCANASCRDCPGVEWARAFEKCAERREASP